MNTISTAQRPWYRQFWPWALAAGPVAVLIAGSVTIWLAVTRPEALVVDDYYKQGNAINQSIQRDRAAAQLGLKADLEIVADGQLEVRLIGDAAYAWPPVIGLLLTHPTLASEDIKVQLVAKSLANGRGVYVAAAPLLKDVSYQLQLQDGDRWRLTGEWPKSAKIVVGVQSADK
ncbi:FixH family protein [Derxia gummosa]|uniref:FixH family protein n=1 Tax=Derxia gummosa DSM 723 TaxID=1121388 RepID=A0A8B6XCI1_9BURK|nr:FixH family protein [Derxia gummosa]